ncbi:MAG: hypothetical protein OXE17_04405 [Chloroflexi bacterium]|nr:hypothetical protein [Chloroflexota bacterium]
MTISIEVNDKVQKLIGQSLRERFKDELVFDPIVVQPIVDNEGEEYLDIFIIYDGPYEKLDPSWTVEMGMRLSEKLLALGITRVPSHSFVPRKDWEKLFRCQHPRADEPIASD